MIQNGVWTRVTGNRLGGRAGRQKSLAFYDGMIHRAVLSLEQEVGSCRVESV